MEQSDDEQSKSETILTGILFLSGFTRYASVMIKNKWKLLKEVVIIFE